MEECPTVHDAAANAANQTILKVSAYWCDFAKNLFTWENLFKFIGTAVILVVTGVVFVFVKRAIKKIPEKRLSIHHSMLIRKLVNYIFYIIVLIQILALFGVKLSALWGAAGIAGVALGFAAQTSVSNLISGIFVLGDKAMKVGDVIVVNGITGIVDSIGLLSIKIHTLDNQMVRIPNSVIINSNFQNNSFFPIRRFLFEVSVAYSTNMEKALEVLLSVPATCPMALTDPEPKAWFDGFLDSGIKMTLAVWCKTSDLIPTKNSIYMGIKKAFDAAGIEIPFNRMDVTIRN